MSTPNELQRPKAFAEQHPETGGFNAIRHQLRNRTANGMIDAGAVIEFYPGAKRTRPIILIDVPRYWRWRRGEWKVA